ncbi:MAG: phage tail protein [Rhizobacter sp.]
MQLSIKTNFLTVQKALDRLSDDIALRASVSATNKTVAQAKTAMSKAIRAEFNLSAAKVAEKLFITKATFKGGRFQVEASLLSESKAGRRSVNVINFQANQTAGGVSIKVKRGGGRKVVKGAFIGNKGRTVFIREGTARLPIRPVQVIDVPQMFNTRKVNAAVIAFIKAKAPEIFDREIKFYVDRFNRSGK